jgi:hypothetical protein
MKRIVLSVIFVSFFISISHASDPLGLKNTIYGSTAAEYNIDPYLLYSISIVESRFLANDGLVRPHPFAIHVGLEKPVSYYPNTREEAEAIVDEALKKTRNIDIGIAQVNYRYNGKLVKKAHDLLDIKTNLSVSASILKTALNSTKDLILGVGRYHQWSDEQAAREYGYKVLRLYNELKSMGGGA